MIYFRKPFKYITEKDFGYVEEVIVAFSKEPILFKHRYIPKGEGRMTETFPAQYRYFIAIDLWLIKIKFSWKGKEKRVLSDYNKLEGFEGIMRGINEAVTIDKDSVEEMYKKIKVEDKIFKYGFIGKFNDIING